MAARINADSERRLDSLAMVLLVMNEHNIRTPAQFNAALDELGARLLGHIKNETGWVNSQMQMELVARDEKMRAGNLVRIGVPLDTAHRLAAKLCEPEAHDFV